MTDPLATERFRTIAADAFRSEFDRVYGDGRQMDEGVISGVLVDHFPSAHFEYRTNQHGVHIRRVVAEGVWEVDPDNVPPGDSLGEQPHDGVHCHNDGRPHLGPCVDT
jgi:hypothetical protein